MSEVSSGPNKRSVWRTLTAHDPDGPWWHRLLTIQTLVLCIWLVGFAVYVISPISDPDTPWHLATGRYILSHHTIPTTDPFSWSMRGHPWVTQEWLFEVMLAWLVNHFQYAGAWLLLVGVETITVFFMYATGVRVSGGNRIVAAITSVLGVFAGLVFWVIRPQIISYLMFAVFMWVLQKVRDGEFRVLWFVPLLFVLWTNSHGSASIGIFMLLLEVLISFIPRLGRFEKLRLPKGARRRLLAVMVVGFFAGLLNPNGMKAYTYALLSTDPLMTNNIVEWFSPNFHMQYFEYGVLPFIIVTFFVILARRKSIPMRETLYFGGAFAMTLIHQRFMPYVAIAASPMLSAALSDAVPRLLRPSRLIRMVNGALCLVALFVFGTRLPQIQGSFSSHMDRAAYPIAAVNYIEQHHLLNHRKLLNLYSWGGYLIYRHIPPFIDGRTDIYLQNNTFSNYLAIQNMNWNGPLLMSSYNFSIVLFPPGSVLATYLSSQPGWTSVYQDGTAEVFVKQKTVSP
ncbi:hypothetical protein [Alicyclobacillus sp. ALC3]|uniref:hypothetical protein n=1 Tax=Alicyclobacillus sp. ALC3 TaxID=2796143 RepID=UPI0023782B14|nr:hypothetical protein [Alicyclobacillus sp. ALC3]